METESVYGVTLSEKKPVEKFELSSLDDDLVANQKLIINSICLAPEAKAGEFNVVEIETKINEKETIKIPIAVLKAGETRSLRPNVEFKDAAVTFRLIEGAGPVYILGRNIISEQEDDGQAEYGDLEEDEFDDDDDDEGAPPPIPQANGKRKK